MIQLGFSLLILFIGQPSWAQQVGIKWSEGEHLELGIEGSTAACKALGISAEKCPNQRIFRDDRKYTFQYGEIVTSADYYNNPTDFAQDKKSAIVKIVKCAYKQKSVHPKQRTEDIEYPSCDSTGVLGIPGYLEVVSQNYNHFGWNNMVAYVEYHGKALQFAKRSYDLRSSDSVQSRAYLNKAMIFNAYADHYLTDAFASGHIRVPRIQIKEWAKDELPGTLRSSRGDLLSMFLHNTESLNLRTRKEEGLRVQNSRGDVWMTRGDGHLNLFATDLDPTLALPRQAVAESFKDILLAAFYGDLPEGVYQATQFVPFQNDMPLIDKLSPEHQHVKKQSDVAWLIFSSAPMSEKFIFFKSDFAKMLDGLANIFVRFRHDVAHDQAQNTELKTRLPNKYLQAYLDVE
ncbi:MAG: hypothetical protein JSU04_01625 [Bdellovibrionales bacterium]|nr:hypothetical protein [Bdellovibrionales bacterium]